MTSPPGGRAYSASAARGLSSNDKTSSDTTTATTSTNATTTTTTTTNTNTNTNTITNNDNTNHHHYTNRLRDLRTSLCCASGQKSGVKRGQREHKASVRSIPPKKLRTSTPREDPGSLPPETTFLRY